jgi:hypothetical protein
MSNYYNSKRKALKIIDDMIKNGKPIITIYHKVSTEFGFGKKIVDDRIELIKDLTLEVNKK